jgi:hypothetical protein
MRTTPQRPRYYVVNDQQMFGINRQPSVFTVWRADRLDKHTVVAHYDSEFRANLISRRLNEDLAAVADGKC